MLALLDFRHGDRPAIIEDVLARFRETARRHRVRCPTCGWQPGRFDHWSCLETGPPEHFAPGCGTAWNTFETRGRCPGCDHQWRWTICLSCASWARHEDWYAPEDEDDETLH